jgi:hypothetical protein
MPRTELSGVYVRSVFKLLRLLGVPQKTVCQQLEVAKPTVSAWATGTRPMPQRYHQRFFALVSQALDDALSRLSQEMAQANAMWQVYEAARTRRQLPQDSSILWKALSSEEQESIRQITGTELDSIDTRWGVIYAFMRMDSPDVRRHLVEQVTQLLNEWQLEIQQPELYREIWEHCQRLGAYGQLDFDTFWQRVSGHPGERAALQRAADMLAKRTRRLDRIVAPLGAEQLFGQVEALKTPATQAQEVMEQGNTHRG